MGSELSLVAVSLLLGKGTAQPQVFQGKDDATTLYVSAADGYHGAAMPTEYITEADSPENSNKSRTALVRVGTDRPRSEFANLLIFPGVP